MNLLSLGILFVWVIYIGSLSSEKAYSYVRVGGSIISPWNKIHG